MAFCNLLAFWTRRDPGRMDRMFRSSALLRSKWDDARTIDSGLSRPAVGRPEGYRPHAVKPIPESEPVSESVAEADSPSAREGVREVPIPPIPRMGNRLGNGSGGLPSPPLVELVFQSMASRRRTSRTRR